jgi:hypothetical protein
MNVIVGFKNPRVRRRTRREEDQRESSPSSPWISEVGDRKNEVIKSLGRTLDSRFLTTEGRKVRSSLLPRSFALTLQERPLGNRERIWIKNPKALNILPSLLLTPFPLEEGVKRREGDSFSVYHLFYYQQVIQGGLNKNTMLIFLLKK